MKNSIQCGDVLDLVVPVGDTVKGVGYMFSGLLAVAVKSGVAGDTEAFLTEGVVEMNKTSAIAFVAGEAIFWDDATKLWKKTATGFFPAGTAIEAAANPSATVKVKLKGFAVAAV